MNTVSSVLDLVRDSSAHGSRPIAVLLGLLAGLVLTSESRLVTAQGAAQPVLCPPVLQPHKPGWQMFGHDATHDRRTTVPGPDLNATAAWSAPLSSLGIQSSPCIGKDTIYIGCDDGRLWAFKDTGATAAFKWKFMVTGSEPFDNNPAVFTGGPLVPNIVFAGSPNGTFYAVRDDPISGAVLQWNDVTGSPIHSSPSISGRKVYYCNDAGRVFVRLVTNGTLLQLFTVGAVPGVSNYCSPSVALTQNNCFNIVYVGDPTGVVHALSEESGGTLWTYPAGADASLPITVDIDAGFVYALSRDGMLHKLHRFSGVLQWKKPFVPSGSGGLTSTHPYAVALGWGDAVYVGNDEGQVRALYKSTGNTKWILQTGSAYIHSHPAVDSNGILYVGSDDSTLRAVQDVGLNSYVILGSVSPLSKHSSTAIAADGTLYIGSRDDGKLYKYQ